MTLQKLIQNIENQQLLELVKQKKKMKPIKIGDTVTIYTSILELEQEILEEQERKNQQRLKDETEGKKKEKKDEKKTKKVVQAYQGTIIAQHKAGLRTTITVRRIFQNVGIEKIFCPYSPLITSIKIIRSAKVRRAKLYYLRTCVGKSTRLKQRFVKKSL